VGKLVIQLEGERTDSRDYYFVERDLGDGAVATMAVRIAPNGADLFVEWRHHTIPPWRSESQGSLLGEGGCMFFGIVVIASAFALLAGLVSIVIMIGAFATGEIRTNSSTDRDNLVSIFGWMIVLTVAGGFILYQSVKHLRTQRQVRSSSLEGFQGQESTAFQLSIRSALEQAIHDAGIADSLLRGLDGPRDANEPLI
jgi:hypothetical protein